MTDHSSRAAGVPTVAFRHDTDADALRDPFVTWDRLRAQHGAFLSDAADHPVWVLARYDDIHTALQDARTFSSAIITPGYRTAAGEPEPEMFAGLKLIPEQLDPPEHTKYRQLLNPLLTPQKVKVLAPELRARCVELIDGFAREGEVEFVEQFARRFPTTIFMGLMGLPVEEADTFLAWVADLMHGGSADGDAEENRNRAAAAAMAIFGYLSELIAARRTEPTDDWVSYLLTCSIDDRPLTQEELMQISFLLYMAGLDTVAGALGYAFRHLAENPTDRRQIIERPDVVPSAVEEFLRAYAIVTTCRVVTREVELGGCPMKPGDRVVLPMAAANRDPDEFPGAADVDLRREANRHLGFGAGPHRCLGSHLARAELAIALEEWHRRIPDYRVAPGAVLRQHVGGVAGLDGLPLVWDA